MVRLSGGRGQVLIMAVVAVLALFMISIMVVEIGNVLYTKIHVQNAADSAAMDAGLWYARSLNIVSITNKVLLITGVAALVMTLTEIPGGPDLINLVQKGQDVFAGTGDVEKLPFKPVPMLIVGETIRNGNENGVVSVPIFNVENFKDDGIKAINPGFNLKRRYVSKQFKEVLNNGGNENEKDKKNKVFYYDEKNGGNRVFVSDADDVYWNDSVRGTGGWKTRSDSRYGGRFVKYSVKDDDDGKGEVPLDIVEKDPRHTVLVVSMKSGCKSLLNNTLLKDKNGKDIVPEVYIAASMVRIQGGTMDLFDVNGASYEARLDHIVLPEFNFGQDSASALSGISANISNGLGSTGKDIGSALDFINNGRTFATDNFLLH